MKELKYVFQNVVLNIKLDFRNINKKIQELIGSLQEIEIAKSSETLTPKSRQEHLQNEIKEVYLIRL